MSGTKSKRPSDLQCASRAVTWFSNYRLQPAPSYIAGLPPDFVMSVETLVLIRCHNSAVKALRRSIKNDYEKYKSDTLKARGVNNQ